MDFATFSRFKRKDRKERDGKRKRDICGFDIIFFALIICLCPHVLKPCYILNVPSCRNLFIVLFAYRVAFFCMFLFSFIFASIYSSKMSDSPFKNITREIVIVDYNKYLYLEAHIFHYPRSMKRKWSGGCV